MSNLSTLKTEIEKSYKKAKNENTKAVNEYLKALNDSYNKQLAAFQKQTAEKKAAVPRNYTDDYDLNAINKLINQRKLKEKMASLGLNNSGANQTLKAGIELAKQNADNMVTIQKNKELSDIDKAYNQYFSSLEADLNSKRDAAHKSLNDKNASLLANLTAKYNEAVKNNTQNNAGSKGGSNSDVISAYNKLVQMNSPKQQMFYIDMLLDDHIISESQANRLRERFGLDNFY